MRFFVNFTCELSRKLRKNPQKKKNENTQNTQNRVQPPKTSPIEQITDRWEPKNSPLQRVTLQCLTSCYRWSNLLRDNVSHLALASAQNPSKIWKYAWKILIFLLWFLTFWPPFDIVRLYPIGAKTWACYCTLLKLEVCLESQQNDERKNAKLWKTRPKFPGLFQTERVPRNLEPSEYFSYCVKEKSHSKSMRFFVNLTCELSQKLRKNPQKKKNENTRKHAKSRTTAKNITYRTNHWPVGA